MCRPRCASAWHSAWRQRHLPFQQRVARPAATERLMGAERCKAQGSLLPDSAPAQPPQEGALTPRLVTVLLARQIRLFTSFTHRTALPPVKPKIWKSPYVLRFYYHPVQ